MSRLERARLLFNEVTPEDMTHLESVSSYNSNYYIFGRYLLYAQSDDDNFTQWFWVLGDQVRPIGGSYISDGDQIIVDEAYT